MTGVAKLVLALFFDSRYLTGRHFEERGSGIRWAIRALFARNVLHLARKLPWPATLTCFVADANRLHFHPDDLNNFQSPGTYFQNFSADIYIGRGALIGPNVGIITANQDPSNPQVHLPGSDVRIGDECWIGMGAVLMPGVTLGPKTVVGAGAVVTRSFPEGHQLVAGVPARVVRSLGGGEDSLGHQESETPR